MSEPIAAALSLTKTNRGAISELRAGAHLLEQGWHVFWSMSPACPVDMVAWQPGGAPIKVEVKTLTVRANQLVLPWPTNDEWDLLLAVGLDRVHEFRAPTERYAAIDTLRTLYGFSPASESIRHGKRRDYEPDPIKHGTWGGYLAHKRRKVPVCAACETARTKRRAEIKIATREKKGHQ